MKIKNTIFILTFLFTIFVFLLLLMILPAKKFSQSENRPLAQWSKPTFEKIICGEYQKEFENYIKDQVSFRETGIQISTYIQKLMGKTEINDVYVGKDGYLFRKFTEEDMDDLYMNKIFSLMNNFKIKQSVPVSIMLIPSSDMILSDMLPYSTPQVNPDEIYKVAKSYFGDALVDVRPAFQTAEDRELLYYKTDHHYTTEGAYLAYREFCKHKGISAREKENFDIQIVAEDFYGTLHSKVLDNTIPPDIISVPVNIPEVEVVYDGKIKDDTLYNFNRLKEKDKYSVFLNGNHGTVEINTSIKNGKSLLVIKDSFANSFIPFILGEYEKIIMLDLRYCDKTSAEILKSNNITEILFLYEITNLLNDKHITNLTQYEDSISIFQEIEDHDVGKTVESSEIDEGNNLFIGDSRAVGLSEYGNMKNTDFFASIGMTVYKAATESVSVRDIGKVTLQELLDYKKYNIVYVMLGINELGCSFEENIEAYSDLLKLCRKSQPNAKIIIMANLHVSKERSENDTYINNPTINKFNSCLSECINDKNVFYLDSNVLFDDEYGNLAEKYCVDSAHLKWNAYEEWGKWILEKSEEFGEIKENENDG